jgi:hypothetical protein
MRHNLRESLIRKKLSDYLSGRLSLRKFRDWFVPATWDVEEWASVPTQELVYEIKLRMAEYTSGYWTEDELRATLLPLATSFRVSSFVPIPEDEPVRKTVLLERIADAVTFGPVGRWLELLAPLSSAADARL